jgi:hypothetical protein
MNNTLFVGFDDGRFRAFKSPFTQCSFEVSPTPSLLPPLFLPPLSFLFSSQFQSCVTHQADLSDSSISTVHVSPDGQRAVALSLGGNIVIVELGAGRHSVLVSGHTKVFVI